MTYVLAAFGVANLITIVKLWVTAPAWVWRLGALWLGVGFSLLIDPSRWWLGPCVAGLASIVTTTEDFLLSAGDRARVEVLRNTRR